MASNKNQSKNNDSKKDLIVLKDLPLFEEGYDEKLDSFHHKVYADNIVKLIESNEPPLSIGLFGPWGSGKSSILNSVKKEIENKNFVCVYFNAWKYGGDSFRRQFLLNAIDKIFSNEEKEDALNDLEKRFHREIPITDTWLKKFYSKVRKWFPKPSLFGMISFSFPMLETNPRLVLPEQFEKEFQNMLRPAYLSYEKYKNTAEIIRNKSFLFIIDDIDRCPPEMVITILDSIKTFLMPKNLKCYFILALDDKAVISVLSERNKNYSDEELLKFFDVTVRMNPFKKYDLVSFANEVTELTKLPGRVIQIAVYGGFDTPRKIKHFLNVFLVRQESAKKRILEGFLTEMPDLNQLSKSLVIEIKYPEIFKMIIENSNMIQKLQEYSEQFNTGKEDKILDEFKKFSSFYRFMWATRYITLDDPHMLIYMKHSQFANELKKDGVKIDELKIAIEQFSSDKLKELISPIQSEKTQKSLVDFIKEELEPASELFLENITGSALFIFKNLKLSKGPRTELCHTIVESYTKEKVNIFNLLDIEPLFECINLLTPQGQHDVTIRKIGITNLDEIKEPQNLNKGQLLNISKFINYLYLKNLIGVNTANSINKTLVGWTESPEQLINLLDNIEISKDVLSERLNKKILMPNRNVLEPLIDKISTKEEDLHLYEEIRKLLFKFWQKSYLEPIDEKLNFIFTETAPQSANFTPLIKFGIETIIDLPDWIDKKNALPIAQHIWNVYMKCEAEDEKVLSLKAFLISVHSVPDQGQADSLLQQFYAQLHTLNNEHLDVILQFIHEYVGPEGKKWWVALENKFVNKIFELVQSNPNNTSLAIPYFEFVWKKRNKLLEMNQVESLFMNLNNHLNTNDNSYSQWRAIILTYAPKIGRKRRGFLAEFCDDLYSKITNVSLSPPIPEIRKKEYLIVLTTLAKTSLNKASRIKIGQNLMSLLFSRQPDLQKIGIESLPMIQDILDKDFGLYLSTRVKELCSKPFDEIAVFQSSILKTMDFQDHWDLEALDGFSDLLLRCLTIDNPQIQNIGYDFLNKAAKLSGKKKRNITKAITNLCIESAEGKNKWEPTLLSRKEILSNKLVDEYTKKTKKRGRKR